ncbi:MAG: 16S rRNA (cytidine(1402)-2'-O)-methyltransferase [Bacteroidota bacterium]
MKLYLVPTPIGNLEDITLRALRILREADIILAEDTRTSSKLLRHYDIDKKVLAHHQFNEHKTAENLVRQIAQGTTMALISDAGTPGISDPGFLLTRACIQAGIAVECLPGPTAFVPALVNSGLPCDRFLFEGFLPHKKGRQTRLKELATQPYTFILYESPFRLVKSLVQLAEYLGGARQACVSRELTKIYEENRRGTLTELAQWYTAHPPKGEIVLIVAGSSGNNTGLADHPENDEIDEE